MSKIAYDERSVSEIKRRQLYNSLYKVLHKVSSILLLYSSESISSILLYPPIQNREEFSDILNRIAWAFPNNKNLHFFISVSSKLKNIDVETLDIPKYQRNYIQKLKHFQLIEENETNKVNVDMILIHEASTLHKPSILKNINKTLIIDKHYFSTVESEALRRGFYKTFSKVKKKEFENLSKEKYSKLLKKNAHKKNAYCFATGPSFDRYKEFDYENSFKVVCNSAVKNEDFLQYINGPDLLVFADPVFHFSPCEYSAMFRDDALKVVQKYKCFVMVPDFTVPLMLAHYPELQEYLIGIKTKNEFNIPNLENYYVKGSSNILTLYMIPVASAISQNIFIIGADGRKPDENYFWKHSSSAQYSDLMQTAFDTHPSFFRDRVYTDYYDRHCKFLDKLLQYGESKGKKYISLTPSYIPALEKRQK